jgi:pimeloyl-ACP methyl ester carboxylesterase
MAEPPEIRYARSGRASIAYAVYGRGTSDLLVINGFVNHLDLGFESPSARHFFDRLGSFARVILFDKRGMGLSDRDAGNTGYVRTCHRGAVESRVDASGRHRCHALDLHLPDRKHVAIPSPAAQAWR